MKEFSLFEGDGLSRLFLRFGIKSRGAWNLIQRFILIFLITALPTAIFCLEQGFGPGQPRALNFFADFAAMCQLFLGYPLFIIAESIISGKTRMTAKHFSRSGLVIREDLHKLEKLHARLEETRRSLWPDLACIVLAYAFSAFWLWEETHNAYDTWHATGAPGVQSPTVAGWWLALVAIPVYNYWWLRWIWKISLWSWYLRKVSKLRLRLIASHPDLTGGLGFLSSTQASFAIVIFAFGIGTIGPLIGYKLDVEGAGLWTFSVAGPLIGFIIGAPAFFTLPLLFFSRKLDRVKKRALDAYQDRSTEASLYFEQKWLSKCHDGDCDTILGFYLSGMNNLNNAYNHIKSMRVVPFDTRSLSQLIFSTLGSLLPILPKVFDLSEPIVKGIELLKSVIPK